MKYILLAFSFILLLAPRVSAEEITLISIKDAELDQEEPDANKGSGIDLQVGATWGEPEVIHAKGLIEFETIATTPESKVVVNSAVIKLHIVGNDLDNAPVDIFRVAEEWNEGMVTWNSRPAENRGIVVTDTPPPLEPPATPWEIDVTEIVQSWYAPFPDNFPCYGFYIDVPDNGIAVDVDIASREHEDTIFLPRLWMDYDITSACEDAEVSLVQFNVSDISRGSAEISYCLQEPAEASIKVYDATGSLVAILVQGRIASGTHTLSWKVSPGVYIVRFQMPGKTYERKAIILN